jgi:hypothetical protein
MKTIDHDGRFVYFRPDAPTEPFLARLDPPRFRARQRLIRRSAGPLRKRWTAPASISTKGSNPITPERISVVLASFSRAANT